MTIQFEGKLTASILAIMTVGGGLYMVGYLPDARSTVGPLIAMVLGFYFGSSAGSQRKDETIAKAMEGKS